MRFVAVVDSCPSDRIGAGDDIWHTVAMLQAGSWTDVEAFIGKLKASLRTRGLQLRKWGGVALSQQRATQNERFRTVFLDALRRELPASRVSLLTVSCQEKTMIAAEPRLCSALGLEHSVVMGDRPSICLGGYTKHWRDGKPVVTLGPFEKISVDGATEVISNPLTVRWENAVVWLWIGHGLWSLYRRVELQYQSLPRWQVHFDRLASDESAHNYPGLAFLELLLKVTTTIDLECSYSEVTAIATDVSTPDLVIDCIAGWVNAAIGDGGNATSLERVLGASCRDHLVFLVVRDATDIQVMRSDFAVQRTVLS
jgi:hypothetical protein